MALSFAFGGDENTSYDDLKRRQNWAHLMQLRGSQGAPKTAVQGLNSAAQSITGALLAKKFGKQEQAGKDEATNVFQTLLGNRLSGNVSTSGSMTPFAPAPQTPADSVASDAMETLVRSGLIQRGLPEHVADGFVMNFKDESGLNPSINEKAPIVPGSRGGFGLSQWTGPRRVELERFAESQGKPVDDINVQMDFLMHELGGAESGAANAIMQTGNSGDAAAAIASKFLRPAQQHLDARVAKYTGNPTVSTQGQSSPQMADLMSAMGNPYMSDSQRSVLGMLLQQQVQGQDPMRQLQMRKTQMEIEKLRNPTEKSNEYGLTPQFVTDAEGNLKMMQLGKDGSSKMVDLPEGMEVSKGLEKVDQGTHHQWFNKFTGEPVGPAIPKNIAEASGQQEAGKQSIDMGGEAWGASGKLFSSMNTIDEAISAIDAGARSGAVDKWLPNITEQSASLSNAMDRMGLDVVGATTFGALSEGELRLAMNTAVPRDLNERELRSWLVRKREATQKSAIMLQNAAAFLSTPGNTLDKWIAQNKTEKTDPYSGADGDGFPDVSQMDAAGIQTLMTDRPSSGWTSEQKQAVGARLRELRGQ